MKKSLLILFCLCALQVATTHAQTSFKYGVRFGVSTPDIKPGDVDSLRFKRGTDSLKLKVSDANYGYHLGAWARLKIGGFYIQPELLFNSSTVEYKVGKLFSALDSVKTETFRKLDVPIMLGTRLGSFRINAGPVAHIHLNSSSDSTWGYQAGIGFDAARVGIDLRYEGNFNNFGDHLVIGGKAYEFSKAPSRFIASVAIAF
jgi:Outer membrane protein beta-barrel domain